MKTCTIGECEREIYARGMCSIHYQRNLKYGDPNVRKVGSYKHGHAVKKGKRSAEYQAWQSMNNRCSNPKTEHFAKYGGRGITVCQRWRESFADFLADVGPRPDSSHSLDRKDVNGNYEPGNVQWATKKAQARNTRSNHQLVIDGVSRCLAEWGELSGNNGRKIYKRLQRGWEPRAAVFAP